MFSFSAYFWNSDVYINGEFHFDSNEILTMYLNDNHYDYILKKEFINKMEHYKQHLKISPNMERKDFDRYNERVNEAMSLLDEIDQIMLNLPPYDKIIPYFSEIDLGDVLSEYECFFETGLDITKTNEYIAESIENEYCECNIDACGDYNLRLKKYILNPFDCNDLEDDEIKLCLKEINENIFNFFDIRIDFVKSYLQVYQIYKPFLTYHVNRKGAFLNPDELVQCFGEYNSECVRGRQLGRKYEIKSLGFVVLTNEKESQMLCEKIEFWNLETFLYYDFFYGIRQNFQPNQCKNCGKFFLNRGSPYYIYCDNPLADESDKTCRDVGSKCRYDE